MTSRRRARTAGAVGFAACLMILAGACSNDDKPSADASSTSTEPSTSSTSSSGDDIGAGGAADTAVTVDVTEFSFTPRATEVSVGEAITFGNVGAARHTVTPDVPEGTSEPWKSVTVSPSETFVVTLNRPGEYAYFCSIHPDRMHGTITVTE